MPEEKVVTGDDWKTQHLPEDVKEELRTAIEGERLDYRCQECYRIMLQHFSRYIAMINIDSNCPDCKRTVKRFWSEQKEKGNL